MPAVAIERRGNSWWVIAPPLTLEFGHAYFNHGILTGVLTVHEGAQVHFRDAVALTREHGRRRILTRLAERGVQLDEQLLLQFEDLYRTQANEKTTTDPSTFSGTPPEGPAITTLEELAAVFERHLLIADPHLLAVLVGAVLAHRLGGEPVWLLVVGPPGSTKSELLRSP